MSNGVTLASLMALFSDGPASREEDDRLVDLFRNRVQLKKEFAALRDENYRLQDAMKRQSAIVARCEQKLASIEELLLDPDWSHNVVTFYQLRAIGNRCHERLKARAERLKRVREEAVQSTMLAAWRRRREDKAFAVKRKISECRGSLYDLEVQLNALRHELDNMGFLRRLLHRRSATMKIESVLTRIEEKRRLEDALLEESQRIEANSPPEKPGLDVRSKRMVNFQILSFAQQLYLQYDKAGLVQALRDARAMNVGSIRYGDKETCEALLAKIRECEQNDAVTTDHERAVAKRTRLIAKMAEFRREEDAVPIPASVSTVFDFDDGGGLLQQHGELLNQNDFGVSLVLMR